MQPNICPFTPRSSRARDPGALSAPPASGGGTQVTAEGARQLNIMVALWANIDLSYKHQSNQRIDAERISQTTMNIAAINGPSTIPFMPKISMPPSVDSSTT